MVALTEQGRKVAAEVAQTQKVRERNGQQNPVYAFAKQAASQLNSSLRKPGTGKDKH